MRKATYFKKEASNFKLEYSRDPSKIKLVDPIGKRIFKPSRNDA